ncbi:hypothetical protein D9M71_144780 [compost metagenome]
MNKRFKLVCKKVRLARRAACESVQDSSKPTEVFAAALEQEEERNLIWVMKKRA